MVVAAFTRCTHPEPRKSPGSRVLSAADPANFADCREKLAVRELARVISNILKYIYFYLRRRAGLPVASRPSLLLSLPELPTVPSVPSIAPSASTAVSSSSLSAAASAQSQNVDTNPFAALLDASATSPANMPPPPAPANPSPAQQQTTAARPGSPAPQRAAPIMAVPAPRAAQSPAPPQPTGKSNGTNSSGANGAERRRLAAVGHQHPARRPPATNTNSLLGKREWRQRIHVHVSDARRRQPDGQSRSERE